MLSTLNDVAVSWAECAVTLNISGGITVKDLDFKSIDHESSVARGEQRRGGVVVKRTTGQLSNAASGSLYRSGLKTLKRAIMANAPENTGGQKQLSRVPFDIVIKHTLEGESDINCTKLLGCRLDKDAHKLAEGPDADMVDVDLNPISIVEIIDGVETVLL